MENRKPYLKVVLDKNATIIEFENNLACCKTNDDEFIGKNWFETFIPDEYLDQIYDVFIDLIMGETKKWKTHKNDIKINDQHVYLDFDNEVIVRKGNRYVVSVGVDHYSQ